MDKTSDGKKFRVLNIIDKYTRECLMCYVPRKIKSDDIIEALSALFCELGLPEYIRSDNGSEFASKNVREWLKELSVKPMYIEPRILWKNVYCESFNSSMRDELLNGKIMPHKKFANSHTLLRKRKYIFPGGF